MALTMALPLKHPKKESVHWFEPAHVPEDFQCGYIGDYIGVMVETDIVDDTLREIQMMYGCTKGLHPLGQVIDDMGTPHYTFIVHPEDTERFAMARLDTRYRGQLSWIEEQTKYSQFPDEFVDFIF